MLSFTLEIRSLICDAAIISPSQCGPSVIRCNINKTDKKQTADLDGRAAFPLQSRYKHWSFSSSDELLKNYKDSLCLSAAPKIKTVAKKKKKKKSKLQADLVSVNQGEVLRKALLTSCGNSVTLCISICFYVNVSSPYPFSEINRLISHQKAK